MWVLLALGAALLTSFNPILYKRMLKDADSLVVVWGVTLLALPLLGIFTFIISPQPPRLNWLFAVSVLGAAGLNAVAHLASTRALKLADVSLVTPLLIFSPVFTVAISAIFLNEIPSAIGILGVILILIGAYWLNRDSDASWLTPLKTFTFTPNVMLVLLAGLLWAITPLLEKTAILHTSPENPRFTLGRRCIACRRINASGAWARQNCNRQIISKPPRIIFCGLDRRRCACVGVYSL